MKQVEINPGVLNQYHVIDGVLRADSLMYLPKLRPWKKSLIQSDWVAAIAIDDQRLELLVNEDHVNGKLISTLKVYLERSDFLEESHFLKSVSLCKYFHRSSDLVISSYLFDGELYHTTFEDLKSYRK